jgi:hypothetical protein
VFFFYWHFVAAFLRLKIAKDDCVRKCVVSQLPDGDEESAAFIAKAMGK